MKKESALAIEIFGKNYNASASLKLMTERKCSKLDKYFKDDENATITFYVTLEGDTYTSDIAVVSRGMTYRASATSDSPFTNLDLVIPKLVGQLRKQKTIWQKKSDSEKKKQKPAELVDDEPIAEEIKE